MPRRLRKGRAMVMWSRMCLVATVAVALGMLGAEPSAGQSSEFPYSEDFEGAVGGEWSPGIKTTSPNGEQFLGLLGEQSVTLSLAGLPQHSGLRAGLDLHIIGTMDGSSTVQEEDDGVTFSHGPDLFTMTVDGATGLKPTTFSNVKGEDDYRQAYPGDYPSALNAAGTGAAATDALGYPPNNG